MERKRSTASSRTTQNAESRGQCFVSPCTLSHSNEWLQNLA